jgi:hypothetical protein
MAVLKGFLLISFSSSSHFDSCVIKIEWNKKFVLGFLLHLEEWTENGMTERTTIKRRLSFEFHLENDRQEERRLIDDDNASQEKDIKKSVSSLLHTEHRLKDKNRIEETEVKHQKRRDT